LWDNLEPITFDWGLTARLIWVMLPIFGPLLIAMLVLGWLESWLTRKRKTKPDTVIYIVNQTTVKIDPKDKK